MKIRFSLITLLLLIYTCDHQLMIPVRDNPFDSASELTAGDPFNLHTQNLSNHIHINWNYTYDKPVVNNTSIGVFMSRDKVVSWKYRKGYFDQFEFINFLQETV